MSLKLRILPRAERDAQQIFDYIAERSFAGALRWWSAFQYAASKSVDSPERYGIAPENGLTPHMLRHFLFKTRRGRAYRGVFVVVGDELRVLRVRGPGQAPLETGEMPSG
jgi:plasmid stabilization system protein ParE